MDSTVEIEPADELLDVVHRLRAQLAAHAARGAWSAPGARTVQPAAPAAITPEPDTHPGEAPVPRERQTLAQIRAELGECTRCKLYATRTNLVFGSGAETAPLMFVGEAPGEQEDLRGEPFVGRAGELLDKMIEAMGWSRSSVYIANVVKSRPPGNRDPEADEIAACAPFLDAQIRAIQPRVIVALGKPAANHLLATTAGIGSLRGRFHDREGIRVMPTFHPAYLLREPAKKREAWADLKLVMAELSALGIIPPQPPRA